MISNTHDALMQHCHGYWREGLNATDCGRGRRGPGPGRNAGAAGAGGADGAQEPTGDPQVQPLALRAIIQTALLGYGLY